MEQGERDIIMEEFRLSGSSRVLALLICSLEVSMYSKYALLSNYDLPSVWKEWGAHDITTTFRAE